MGRNALLKIPTNSHKTSREGQVGYAVRKIPVTIALSPQANSFVAREAKLMQVTTAEIIRRMIDREIERERRAELARDRQKLDFKLPATG